MIDLAALALFVTLALGGTLHCLAMCGGVALAVAASGPTRSGRLLLWQGTYALGKALTYGVLGLVVSLGAGALVGRDPLAASAGGGALVRLLPLFAGIVLVLIGLSRWGLFRGLRRGAPGEGAAPLGPLRRMMVSLRLQPGLAGPFGTGVLNGLLPCGLSLGALALAVAVDPVTAFVGMVLFGIATAPGLVALGWLPHLATLPLRRHAGTLQGAAWVFSGLFLVGRPVLFPPDPAAPCCAPGESDPARLETLPADLPTAEPRSH